MVCKTSAPGTLGNYQYVVCLSFYDGKILLSRHRNRTTWETQGGHIELGETPLDAAKRELFEESGAVEFDMEPVCDYWAMDETDHSIGYGMAFWVDIRCLGPIPESEMAEVAAFERLPENLTYPDITPVLFERVNVK